MNTYYFIDFENVASRGLEGCNLLNETDQVFLFYTESGKHISLDLVDDLAKANCVKFKVPVRKQSVDMHLVTYLGYMIGQNKDNKDCEYVVISKDADFDNIIQFWSERYSVKIRKNQSIAKHKNMSNIPPQSKKNILNVTIMNMLRTAKYPPQIVGRTASIVASNFGKDRGRLLTYRGIISEYGRKTGLEVYNVIKDHLDLTQELDLEKAMINEAVGGDI